MKNLKTQIKLIMFDLDGTLIDHECQMSETTIQMLKTLKKSPYKLCLTSGRPYSMSSRVLESFGVEDCFDYVFGCNGSEFFDPSLQKVVMLRSLKPETIADLSKFFAKPDMVLCLVGTQVLYTDRPCKLEIAKYYARTRKISMEEIDFTSLNEEWPKALGMLEDHAIEEVQMMIKDLDDPRYDAYFSNKNLLELVPKGVSKYDACDKLMQLIEDLKAEEILSFGDADNDLPMLCNTTGVLMGNAKAEIHGKVSRHAKSVDEDGVYHYLKEAGFLD